MYTTSIDFKTYIKKASRLISSRVVVNTDTYTANQVVELSLESNLVAGEEFTIGSTICNQLKAVIATPNIILESYEIKPYMGLDIEGVIEEVPLGIFTIDEVVTLGASKTITAYDNMIKLEKPYFSDLVYPATIQNIALEICAKGGLTFSSTLPSVSLPAMLEGKTLREAIGVIGGIVGKFTKVNRLGAIEMVGLTSTDEIITPANFYGNLAKSGAPFVINKVTAVQEDEVILSSGIGSAGEEVTFDNNYITQSQLDAVFATYSGYTYQPLKVSMQGNPALDVGDKISITDVDNVVYVIPIMKLTLSYKGGMKSDIEAIAKTESKSEYNYKGTVGKKIEVLFAEQLNVRNLLVDTATIENLTAVNARIDNLDVVYATIYSLGVTNATMTTLIADDVTIQDLVVNDAFVQNLLAKNLTAANIRADSITAVEIKSGTITSASGVIADLSANDITAGTLSVERLIIRGATASIVYQLNNITGALQSQNVDTLNGEVLTPRTVTADKIIAHSITANEMVVGTITAASGIISELDASLITVTGLVVGENVQMGLGAYISWNNVTDQPTIPTLQSVADAQADATQAIGDASNAQTDANTANGLLDDIANDGKLTPVEKKSTKKEWDAIVSEKSYNDSQATLFGVSSTNYDNAYNTLSSYISPLLTSLSTTSTLVGTTFRINFVNYYDERTLLLNAISVEAKNRADNAQTDANTAQSDVETLEGNVPTLALAKINATYIDVNGIWTPSVYAQNISTITAKISTAQIETLTVGSNVVMGVNAEISWKNVTNVELGGLNYYGESTSISGILGQTYIRPYPECDNGLYFGGVEGDTGVLRFNNVITGNGDWVVSFEFKGDQSSAISFDVDIADSVTKKFYTTNDNTWSKVVYTANVTNYSDSVYEFMDFSNIAWARFYVRNLKIEKGTVSTDWSPNPEDVQGGIDTAQSQANLGVTNASTAQAKADSAYTNAGTAQAGVNDINTRTSAITSTKITGTSIESCTITGNTINGGTINGAVINQVYGTTVVGAFYSDATGGRLDIKDSIGRDKVTIDADYGLSVNYDTGAIASYISMGGISTDGFGNFGTFISVDGDAHIYGDIKLPNSTLYEDATFLHIDTNLQQIYMNKHVRIEGGQSVFSSAGNTSFCGLNATQAWKAVWSYAFTNASDRRLKEDIIEMNYVSSYESIKDMKTYSYKYKSDKTEDKDGNPKNKRSMIGVLTDELPLEVVSQENFDGVNLYSLLTLNISALKEAISKIEILEKEVIKLGGDL